MTGNNKKEKITFDLNVISKSTWNCVELGIFFIDRDALQTVNQDTIYAYIMDHFSDFFKDSSQKSKCKIIDEFWGMACKAICEEYSDTQTYYYTVTNIHLTNF